MGVGAGDYHRLRATLQAPGATGRHQGHQIRQGSAAGSHAPATRRQAKPFGEPGHHAPFQAGQAGGELLGEQVVVQAGTDQICHHRRPKRRGIEVGQGPWMVGVVGPVHHQLEIGQEGVVAEAQKLGLHLGQHAQAG